MFYFSTFHKPNPDEPEPNRKKRFLYPDFTNRPDQKSNGLNPGDSANPDTTIKSLLFLHRFNFKVTKVVYDRQKARRLFGFECLFTSI
jgi:hypothetical protein